MAFTSTSTSIDNILLPPPAKVLKRGTPEIEDAMKKGEVTFSLPPQELASWLHPQKQQKSDASMDVEDASTMASDSKGSMHTCTDYLSFHNDMSEIQTSLNEEMHDDRGDHQVDEEATQPQKGDDSAGNESHASCDMSASSKVDITPSNARKRDIKTMPEQARATRFRDIIGHGAVKLRLDEILLPLALPTNLADSILTGIRSTSASILLYGPPGCGKTQLAKAIAGEAQAAFISVGPSDILSKFVGESEASIRSMFDKAFEQAKEMESRCTVLFFDEIDALGQSRGVSGMPSSEQSGGGGDVSSRRLLAELLIQLNRINSSNGSISDDNDNDNDNDNDDHGGGEEDQYPVDEESVDTVYQDHDYDTASVHQDEGPQKNRARVIVVAATNRPEDCDPALVRRFAVRVSVGLPSKRDRKKILNRYLGDVAHNITKSELDGLATMTDGWSGSDLESLTREAAMAPIRECIRAAALLKRRIRRGEQSGGDSSCEEDQPDSDHHEQARDTLLQHFKTLRQVTEQDFQDAISFWMGNHSCDGNSQLEGLNDSRRLTHYDSSSDEDD